MALQVEGPRELSPWWASLFEEGAISDWHYTFHNVESEPNEEGEWVELVNEARETEVRCVVSRVRREGALWASTVTCVALDPSIVDIPQPQGDWYTDGATRLYYETLPPERPTLTDPPSRADLEAACAEAEGAPDGVGALVDWPACEHERPTIMHRGDSWCLHHTSIGGGRSVCFQKGVGPTSYELVSSPSIRTTTSTLTRR